MPKQVNQPAAPAPSVPEPSEPQQVDILAVLGLNLETLKAIVDNSKKFETDPEFFAAMSAISFAKKQVQDALEVVESLETDAKGLINAKAKALYGEDWQVIRGEHFKISRQFTGSVYELGDTEKIDPEFLKVKFGPNTRTIDVYRETHDNALPEGITINERRGESIRIAIK